MKKLFLILHFAFCILNYSFAQPTIQWQKCLGGTGDDVANSIQQTTDGGYIVAGFTTSNDGDVTGFHSSRDYWIVKLNSSGNIQWQKCLGGTGWDEVHSVQQTTDGGYIVAGTTGSNDGDVTSNHGNWDYWIVKLNNNGNIQWQKCLGGTGEEGANSVQQTADGGYIVAGYTKSNDGDVTGLHVNFSYPDFWVVKLDNNGNIQWQKCLGGIGDEQAYSVQQTADGGYIVAGLTTTSNNNGDVSGLHGYFDYWIVKLDNNGNIQWQKCLGGTDWDLAYSVQQTTDGGYIVAGSTQSNDGNITGNHSVDPDNWVVKLDNSGNIQWQKCFGGTYTDFGFSARQAADGGYIIAGYAGSNDGDVIGNHDADYWVIKLNNSGTIQWQKCLGGTDSEEAHSVEQTADGGFIVAGYARSNDGDVTGFHGTEDYWIVKLAPYVGIEEETNNGAYNIFPNPFTAQAVISFDRTVYNATLSLYNLLGEKVIETTGISGESFELNRSNLPSGVYVFEVREKNKSIARGMAVAY